MRILLVGSGAREHVIADCIKNNELFGFLSNKNPGIYKACKEFVVGNVTDTYSIAKFAQRVKPQLAIIGPEAPLAAGVVDELEKIGVSCFGPTKELSQLETSKTFTRLLMERNKISGNPKFTVFNKDATDSDLLDCFDDLGSFVLKPDGLTSGKGVKVFGEHFTSNNEALEYCHEVLSAHSSIIVEEKLDGEEFSLQSITDGKKIVDCPPVQDHKRAFENDTGPNTGGMGSYSDADHLLPFLKREHVEQAHEITQSVVSAIRRELGEYKGVMYGGFMLTRKGIRLIEYNARFGDPEAMNVLPIMENSFVDVCMSAASGDLNETVSFRKLASVCKYVVPKGYPGNPSVGQINISSSRALCFFAAVNEENGILTATKSRTAAFVGFAPNIAEAEKIAEDAACNVKGDVYHRKDIGTSNLIQKRIDHVKNLAGEIYA